VSVHWPGDQLRSSNQGVYSTKQTREHATRKEKSHENLVSFARALSSPEKIVETKKIVDHTLRSLTKYGRLEVELFSVFTKLTYVTVPAHVPRWALAVARDPIARGLQSRQCGTGNLQNQDPENQDTTNLMSAFALFGASLAPGSEGAGRAAVGADPARRTAAGTRDGVTAGGEDVGDGLV